MNSFLSISSLKPGVSPFLNALYIFYKLPTGGTLGMAGALDERTGDVPVGIAIDAGFVHEAQRMRF
jgi:hypothetical protein